MRKGLKKMTAVALSAGLIVSSLLVNGVTAKAEEATTLKKGTVITDFKEITDVNELEPGTQYFFSVEKFGAEDAVAALPRGSAILQFAGTDVEKAVEDGTFEVYLDCYESFDSYVQYRYDAVASWFILTEEELYEMLSKEMEITITSWDQVLEIYPDMADVYPTVDAYLAEVKKDYEEEIAYLDEYEGFALGESGFLEKQGFDTWKEFAEYDLEDKINGEIPYLPDQFSRDYVQQEQDGYVTVVQRGNGFDGCNFGAIAYLLEVPEAINEEIDENNGGTSVEGAGWYYGCNGGGVCYVGPFYLYSYKVNEFTEDDLIIGFADDWKEPTAATRVSKDAVTLSVVIDGEEIFIPFFELTDSSVDPTNDDTTITLKVGEIEKVIEVCDVEPGEIDKDVQIEEGAPTVGLEDALDALKEAVLTEVELKLVENGVDVDIYMTVAGKDVEDLGEDKAAIEEIMSKDEKAVYLDLKLFKKVGNNDPTAISEVPGGKIKVSIEVPDDIKEFAANAKVVRVHGTEVTELATTYDAATNKLTFETDKFSTYAIVYSEVTTETDKDTDTDSGVVIEPDDNDDEEIIAPDTGDSSTVGLYLMVSILSAVVILKRKKAINL